MHNNSVEYDARLHRLLNGGTKKLIASFDDHLTVNEICGALKKYSLDGYHHLISVDCFSCCNMVKTRIASFAFIRLSQAAKVSISGGCIMNAFLRRVILVSQHDSSLLVVTSSTVGKGVDYDVKSYICTVSGGRLHCSLDTDEKAASIKLSGKRVTLTTRSVIQKVEIDKDTVGVELGDLFRRCLRPGSSRIEARDKWLLTTTQEWENTKEFCLACIQQCKDLKNIDLLVDLATIVNERERALRRHQLSTFAVQLKKIYGVELTYDQQYTDHQRRILFNNGWTAYLDRGLDFYQAGEGELKYRPCKHTAIFFERIF